MTNMITAVDDIEDKLDTIISLLGAIFAILKEVHEKDCIRVKHL